MTKEENIATLNEHLDHWKRLLSEKICDQSEGEKTIDALQNAIKALEQEPCDDAVSRQAAINAAIDGADKWDGGFNREREKCIREEIEKLPPVTPQQKWILCKDRMPDYHQLVLTFDGEYICVEQRIPYIIGENGEHIESEWWVDVNYVPDGEFYSGLRDGAAVAWMPLPEPYKSEIPAMEKGEWTRNDT